MVTLQEINQGLQKRNQYTAIMRQPLLWIGRKAPRGVYWEHLWRTIDICDDCQCLWLADEMHSLLYPQSQADFDLQRAVGVEEAQTFCPTCRAEIEADADAVDSNWRERHQ